MVESALEARTASCKTCGCETEAELVHVALWTGGRLAVMENVPVRVCEVCHEQYYDEETSKKILQLANDGFPEKRKVREMTVPVFTLDDQSEAVK